MKKQDILSLMVTFAIGVVAGGYLYLTGFAPQLDKITGQSDEVYDHLLIGGSQYGGFRTGTPPSFQVRKDGSFSYVGFISEGETGTAKNGTLPRALWSEVRAVMVSGALYTAATAISVDSCASFVDGVDYRYDIELDTVLYTLDTCGTNLLPDSAMRQTLDKLWNYFATLE